MGKAFLPIHPPDQPRHPPAIIRSSATRVLENTAQAWYNPQADGYPTGDNAEVRAVHVR